MNTSASGFNNTYIIGISFISALGGYLFGFDFAVISGALPFLRLQFGLSPAMEGFVTGSLALGCIIGCLLAGVIAGFQIFSSNANDQNLANLTNQLASATANLPDLTTFLNNPTGMYKLTAALTALTLPDFSSTQTLPLHGETDSVFVITYPGGSPSGSPTLNYKDWVGTRWVASPYGGWLVQSGTTQDTTAPDGTFVVTKHERTGGWVIIPSIKEQLVYEMGDPHSYITPDCVADFTTVRLEYEGRDRVRVFGIEGRPATDTFKVSISYSAGYKAVGTLVYSWPEAYEKAWAADRILRARLDRLGLKFDQILTEFVGANATHGPLAGEPSPDLPEVQLRVAVRGEGLHRLRLERDGLVQRDGAELRLPR